MKDEGKDLAKAGAAIAGIFAAFALVVAALYYFSEGQRNLRKCETELKSLLKAPSTYRRIDYYGGGSIISIKYEAMNSFGVPLRSSGYCNIDKASGAVTWLEMP